MSVYSDGVFHDDYPANPLIKAQQEVQPNKTRVARYAVLKNSNKETLAYTESTATAERLATCGARRGGYSVVDLTNGQRVQPKQSALSPHAG